MAKRTRSAAQVRRSPRAVRHDPAPVGPPARPLTAPFAAAFAVLTAMEMLYLVWLLVDPGAGYDTVPGWPVALLLVIAAWEVVGAVLVVRGRWPGWQVLAAGSIPPLLGLLAIAMLFGSLGAGGATWWGLLLTVGPLGALVLACGRPVREWTSR